MSAYSERETKILLDKYTENPCLETVATLSVMLNKPRKSIISKLSKEGVYQSKGYVDKRGEPPITKLAIVRTLEEHLNIPLLDLDKAPKLTLKALESKVAKLTRNAEYYYNKYNETQEALEACREMHRIKNI